MNSLEIFTAILIFIALSAILVLYFKSPKTYTKYKPFIRKVYYGILILSGFIAFALGELTPDVTTLGILAVLAVFVDLAILQTPNITKFMNNEFNHDAIEETIHDSEELLALNGEKLVKVNEINRDVWENGAQEDFDFSQPTYERFVMTYLKDFTDVFGMDLFPYYIPFSDDSADIRQNISDTYRKIEEKFNLNILAVGMRKRHVIEKLESGKSIVIVDKKCSYVIVPYFGRYDSSIYVIASENGMNVSETDASFLLNMLLTMEKWLVCNEDDLIDDASDDYNDEEPIIVASNDAPTLDTSDNEQ